MVLMFSATWGGPCKAMYPDNRRLLERFSDEPSAVLSVMADTSIDTVRLLGGFGGTATRVPLQPGGTSEAGRLFLLSIIAA